MKTTRHALFDQVWEKPMVQLAKIHGCSDVGLRKTCISFNIPLPPQGHWQRIQYGKGYTKPELPDPNFNPEIIMHPVNRQRSIETAEKEKEITASLSNIAGVDLKPITDFTNLHPLMKQTYDLALVYEREIKRLTKKWDWHDRDKFEVSLDSDKGRYRFDSTDKCFPFVASIPSIFRSIKFLDPLLKAIEAEGFHIKVFRDASYRYHGKETVFVKDGIEIKARIREGYSRISSKTCFRKDIPKYIISDYEEQYYPNGILYFEISHYYVYQWHIFKDLQRHSVEDQLPLIFNFIISAPAKIKAENERRRIEQARRDHIRAVNEFNHKRSQNRAEQFHTCLKEAQLFKQMTDLKDYLEVLEHQSLSLSKNERAITNQWLSLVRIYADTNNPINRRVNTFKQIARDPEVKKYEYWMMDKKEY